MVARDSFGSAIFKNEDQGTSTGYGNSAEEMDDIEEELQVRPPGSRPLATLHWDVICCFIYMT